jgi:hypothetical protein
MSLENLGGIYFYFGLRICIVVANLANIVGIDDLIYILEGEGFEVLGLCEVEENHW